MGFFYLCVQSHVMHSLLTLFFFSSFTLQGQICCRSSSSSLLLLVIQSIIGRNFCIMFVMRSASRDGGNTSSHINFSWKSDVNVNTSALIKLSGFSTSSISLFDGRVSYACWTCILILCVYHYNWVGINKERKESASLLLLEIFLSIIRYTILEWKWIKYI